MAYAVAVMVVDRRSRRGLAGQRVKCHGGREASVAAVIFLALALIADKGTGK